MMLTKRKFTWESWDFDCDGDAYIIAKDLCPDRDKLPNWIVKEDNLDPLCADMMTDDISSGWCKYQCRSDWSNDDGDGRARGSYYVTDYESETKNILTGKRNPGWFPVWIVRKGEWY